MTILLNIGNPIDYVKRYRNGEYERVWGQLHSLGPAVREEPHYSAARKVATETMRRVRRNCKLIIYRLRDLGYAFGAYPDGSTGYYTQGQIGRASCRERVEVTVVGVSCEEKNE